MLRGEQRQATWSILHWRFPYRLHNPNAKRGAYHFTGSEVERDLLISYGWEYQGIGWYSCLD